MSVDVVRDRPPLPLAPTDPSVRVPASVTKAAKLAESFYAQPPEEPKPEVKPEEKPVAVVDQPVEAAPASSPLPEGAQPVPPQVSSDGAHPQPTKEELQSDSWAARYNSMHGRWKQQNETIEQLQSIVTDLGNELQQTQELMRRQGDTPQNKKNQGLTPQDEETFGSEVVDLVRRGVRAEVGEEITELKRENAKVKRVSLHQALDQQLANWREIDKSPRWKNWLRLRDVYSGAVRKDLLDRALRAGDAPRVLQFFKGFLDEERATGHAPSVEQSEPQVPPAPRQAALQLAQIAAPGRERSASGHAPAGQTDKPIFTRAQIRELYDRKRRGYYNGRQDEFRREEEAIFLAQNEGRVR